VYGEPRFTQVDPGRSLIALLAVYWASSKLVGRARGAMQRSAQEATHGQTDGFFSQLPYKFYLKEVAFVGD